MWKSTDEPETWRCASSNQLRDCFDPPTFAVNLGQELFRVGMIWDAHLLRFPLQGHTRHAGGDVAELDGFGERAGVIKSCGGLGTTEDGVHPRVVMIARWLFG